MKKLLIILLLIQGYGFAQPPLSIDDAINIALKNSYDIQLARNNVEINAINNDYGVAGGLPVVSGSLTDNEQITDVNQKLNSGEHIQRKGAVGNSLSSGIEGSMLLYNGMRVIATKKRLEALEKQNQEYLNATIQNTIATVM